MAELSPTFEHEPLPPSGEGALDEGQKETKSSRDTSSTGAEVKQAILEIPNGQAIDGQPVAPGPQYKRGRGRSFFKDAPRKGVSCQGRFNFPGRLEGTKGIFFSFPDNYYNLISLPCVPQCPDAIGHYTNSETITRYGSSFVSLGG
jgi:hypothetical protein